MSPTLAQRREQYVRDRVSTRPYRPWDAGTIDDMLVEVVLDGHADPADLTHPEMTLAVCRAVGRGLSVTATANLLRISRQAASKRLSRARRKGIA